MRVEAGLGSARVGPQRDAPSRLLSTIYREAVVVSACADA